MTSRNFDSDGTTPSTDETCGWCDKPLGADAHRKIDVGQWVHLACDRVALGTRAHELLVGSTTRDESETSAERKHGGHRVVEMATMRLNMLLNIDRALALGDHHLANALTEAFRAVNESLVAELTKGSVNSNGGDKR